MTPELDEKLSALLDDELPAEEAAALRAEIERRPELQRRLAELAAVDAGLRALPTRPVPADLRARVGARVDAERETPARRDPAPRRRRWREVAAFAAAAAALALFVLPRLRSDPEPTPEVVARTMPEPPPEVVARTMPEPPPEVVAQTMPEPTPLPADEPDLERLARELLEPSPRVPAAVEDEDLPVIAVLDVLAELDELEGAG